MNRVQETPPVETASGVTMQVNIYRLGKRVFRETVANFAEARTLVERELKGWMNPDDTIGWYFSSEEIQAKRPDAPDVAEVMSSVGEFTDTTAFING